MNLRRTKEKIRVKLLILRHDITGVKKCLDRERKHWTEKEYTYLLYNFMKFRYYDRLDVLANILGRTELAIRKKFPYKVDFAKKFRGN